MLGEQLMRARKAKHMSRPDLARVLQVIPNTIWRWEKGEREPDDETKSKLAAALDVSVAYLMGESENDKDNCIQFDINKNKVYSIPVYKYSKLRGEEYPTMTPESYTLVDTRNLTDINPLKPPFALEQDISFRMANTAGISPLHMAVVNPAVPFISGKVYLVGYNGQSFVRRVYDNPDNSKELVCDGERQTITAINAQAGKFIIVGKVVKGIYDID